jgi:hypothetical protein
MKSLCPVIDFKLVLYGRNKPLYNKKKTLKMGGNHLMDNEKDNSYTIKKEENITQWIKHK